MLWERACYCVALDQTLQSSGWCDGVLLRTEPFLPKTVSVAQLSADRAFEVHCRKFLSKHCLYEIPERVQARRTRRVSQGFWSYWHTTDGYGALRYCGYGIRSVAGFIQVHSGVFRHAVSAVKPRSSVALYIIDSSAWFNSFLNKEFFFQLFIDVPFLSCIMTFVIIFCKTFWYLIQLSTLYHQVPCVCVQYIIPQLNHNKCWNF